MPRGKLKIEDNADVRYLTILDETGDLDEALEPDLSDDLLRKLLRTMLLSRRFDDSMLQWQRQGRIGTFAPAQGQEASQLGAVVALRESDWMVPAFRETTASLWRGTPLDGILLFNAGYNEGGQVPEGQNDLPIAIPVASQLPHAVGIGYGIKYRRKDDVVLTFFGDGATSEGDFHEAMNYAAVFGLPVVFVCQNNQWAISVPRDRQTASDTLAQKALAYGMPAFQVDGNDLLAVYAATRDAVERARSGDGPMMIECETYRLSVHTTADDPGKYRSEEEVEQWKQRDPLPRFRQYLQDRQLITEDDFAAWEDEVEAEIKEAWRKTEERIAALEGPLHMFEHVYAELPPLSGSPEESLCRGRGCIPGGAERCLSSPWSRRSTSP